MRVGMMVESKVSLVFSASVIADQTIIIEIEGMTCKVWPLAIKKSLSAIEGVKDVKVSFEKAKAWLTVTKSIDDQVFIDAVSKAGPFKGNVTKKELIE